MRPRSDREEDGCGYILGCITREIQQRHLKRVDVCGVWWRAHVRE